jgi:hypothetical protein
MGHRKKKNKGKKKVNPLNGIRERSMEQGFYDGRYKQKVVTDKKKQDNKRKAKQKIDVNE